MSMRSVLAPVLLLLVIAQAQAKKKEQLPDEVLKAQTVLFLIFPDARAPLTNPPAVETIRDDMEKAMMKWGRFRVARTGNADLLIVARKGHVEPPTYILPPNDKGPVNHPNSGGPAPDPNTPGLAPPRESAQRTAAALLAEEDSFEVYRGGIEHPLDAAAIWQYRAVNALRGPKVPAIERFRKAIEESERQLQQKP